MMCHFKELLVEMGCTELYENNYVSLIDQKRVICKMKERYQTSFMTSCMQDLGTFPILRTYVQFKTEFEMEEYLLVVKDYKIRKCISKFRLSNHNLMIEKGRHMKPKVPIEVRVCNLCNVIEDELHFLMVCPKFCQERVILFSIIYSMECNILVDDAYTSFINIMGSTNPQVLFSLGKYLKTCFKLHT